ncbi:DUF5518 domain-containing protein [Halosimplex litoreum]|uniref:DUF5518 domain-containing protein n=1 Tax=Halosimplex litoreum TaxID=1198301 RepID=A0A7T3FX06_9EURY|nr:DUF5518 domain-containing protein [Halosimplex litoreum]QPV62286.1 DUF5518 domain-containing protein [Halosimplex litoreum]
MDEGNTLVNALIGAVVSTVAGFFLPFAPLFGGALAGYFQGGTRSDGLRVGAISGAIALLPSLALGFLVLSVFGFIALGSGEAAGLAIGGIILLFLFVFAVLYFVGLSALGGWIGNYVKYDTDIDV